jgi:rubrerythrin
MKPSTKPTDLGANRTGIKTSPANAKKQREAAAAAVPNAAVETMGLAELRAEVSSESEPVGTVPPPATLKGAVKAAIKAVQGEKLTVFLDLIGERLAFERTGVRLYDALLAKLEAAAPHPEGPTSSDLRTIRDQELAHFHLLAGVCEELGGDSTAVTPAADIIGVASSGLVKVVTDPHTTFNQALKAALIAELADNDGWTLLSELANQLDLSEIAEQFDQAAEVEEEHLTNVRNWLERSVAGEAGIEFPDMEAPGPTSP